MLENLKLDDSVENQDEDFVPGGDFTLPTAIYPMNVDMAFLGESAGGALSVTVHLKEVGGKRTHRETFYVTSRKQADGTRRNTYTDKKSGKQRPLPGMQTVNALAQVAGGKKLHELTPEEKVIKLYNFEEKKELPTKVQALTELMGAPILVAIVKKRENKRKNVDGKWIDTPEERIFNEATKFMHPDGRTVAETVAGETEPKWRTAWEGKFDADYVLDKYVQVANSVVPAASMAAAASADTEVDSLFGEDAPEAEVAPAVEAASTVEETVAAVESAAVEPVVAVAPEVVAEPAPATVEPVAETVAQ